MSYKEGQAVITNSGKLYWLKTKISEVGWDAYDSDGIGSSIWEHMFRPATEAEILKEAQRHGWVINTDFEIEGKHINLFKNIREGWRYAGGNAITTQNLKELCTEGLIADRLIKALNLSN